MQQAFAQIIHTAGQVNLVAFLREALQGVEQGLEHRQVCGRAHTARVGWKVKQHDGQLA